MWSVLVPPKMNHIGLGRSAHVRNPEIIEMTGFRFQQIESYQSEITQNDPTELLSISFPKKNMRIETAKNVA